MLVTITNQSDLTLPALAFSSLAGLSEEYPGFHSWFIDTVLPGLSKAERSIVLHLHSGRVTGAAILKHSAFEKKICTLKVDPRYQGNGIGTVLLRSSFLILETESPIISVSDLRMDQFKKILKYHNFKQTQVIPDLYKPNINEIVFNGVLQ